MSTPSDIRNLQRGPLQAILRKKRVSQTRLAERLGETREFVYRFCSGHVALTPYWIARLGRVLALTDMDVRALVEGSATLDYARRRAAHPSRPLDHPLDPSHGDL